MNTILIAQTQKLENNLANQDSSNNHLKTVTEKFAELKQIMEKERSTYFEKQVAVKSQYDIKVQEISEKMAELSNQVSSKNEVIGLITIEKDNKDKIIETLGEKMTAVIKEKRAITERLREVEESREQEQLDLKTQRQEEVEIFQAKIELLEVEKTDMLTKINELGNKLVSTQNNAQLLEKSNKVLQGELGEFDKDIETIYLKGRVVALKSHRDQLQETLQRLRDNFYIVHNDKMIRIEDEDYQRYLEKMKVLIDTDFEVPNRQMGVDELFEVEQSSQDYTTGTDQPNTQPDQDNDDRNRRLAEIADTLMEEVNKNPQSQVGISMLDKSVDYSCNVMSQKQSQLHTEKKENKKYNSYDEEEESKEDNKSLSQKSHKKMDNLLEENRKLKKMIEDMQRKANNSSSNNLKLESSIKDSEVVYLEEQKPTMKASYSLNEFGVGSNAIDNFEPLRNSTNNIQMDSFGDDSSEEGGGFVIADQKTMEDGADLLKVHLAKKKKEATRSPSIEDNFGDFVGIVAAKINQIGGGNKTKGATSTSGRSSNGNQRDLSKPRPSIQMKYEEFYKQQKLKYGNTILEEAGTQPGQEQNYQNQESSYNGGSGAQTPNYQIDPAPHKMAESGEQEMIGQDLEQSHPVLEPTRIKSIMPDRRVASPSPGYMNTPASTQGDFGANLQLKEMMEMNQKMFEELRYMKNAMQDLRAENQQAKALIMTTGYFGNNQSSQGGVQHTPNNGNHRNGGEEGYNNYQTPPQAGISSKYGVANPPYIANNNGNHSHQGNTNGNGNGTPGNILRDRNTSNNYNTPITTNLATNQSQISQNLLQSGEDNYKKMDERLKNYENKLKDQQSRSQISQNQYQEEEEVEMPSPCFDNSPRINDHIKIQDQQSQPSTPLYDHQTSVAKLPNKGFAAHFVQNLRQHANIGFESFLPPNIKPQTTENYHNQVDSDIDLQEKRTKPSKSPYQLEDVEEGAGDNENEEGEEEVIPMDSALQRIRGTANPNLQGGYKKRTRSPFSKEGDSPPRLVTNTQSQNEQTPNYGNSKISPGSTKDKPRSLDVHESDCMDHNNPSSFNSFAPKNKFGYPPSSDAASDKNTSHSHNRYPSFSSQNQNQKQQSVGSNRQIEMTPNSIKSLLEQNVNENRKLREALALQSPNYQDLSSNIADLAKAIHSISRDNEKLKIELKLKQSGFAITPNNPQTKKHEAYTTKLEVMEEQLQRLEAITDRGDLDYESEGQEGEEGLYQSQEGREQEQQELQDLRQTVYNL